ncbi:SpoIIE family protein phosphatase [Candidatus Pseudoruminococcus sp.]|uniref:SpoIIE family protein phosphatase n=1 Tax=Candidatus Pseudoruminococcus sp. TaxID=3101048 RepID=UPI003999C293
MVQLRLFLTGLCPVILSVILYIINKRTAFEKLKEWKKQLIYGLAFGGLAILGTECGVPVDGATMNVRDASPICAGIIFGAPAGIISALIGGVERYLATYWGAGEYTQIACSLSTIFAGLIAALLRKYMFDNKKPAWYYGLAVGMVIEVLHMLMIFITNMNDVNTAFTYVENCSAKMIIFNGASVMLAVMAVSIIGKIGSEKKNSERKYINLAQMFQRWLLVCVVVAFIVTVFFSFILQTGLAINTASSTLRLYTEDVRSDIKDASDENLIKITRSIKVKLDNVDSYNEKFLEELLKLYNVSEINIVDENGIIICTTNPDFDGFDMSKGSQSSEFLALLDDKDEMVQKYQPTSYKSSTSMKYAGIKLSKGGFLQVGYDFEKFQADIDDIVIGLTRNRHIGEKGYIIIADEDFKIVSDPNGNEGEKLSVTGMWLQMDNEDYKPENGEIEDEGQLIYEEVYGQSCYCMYRMAEGYYIIGIIPESEVVFSRNVSVYVTIFMEIVIFAVLFALIYFLIKKLVVENIQKINDALGKITGGNLNVYVDVRTNEEFVSLSDDINSTVLTLKGYIAEAAARIDKELEFAKTIQSSALPCVFPPYPERTDFDIYASMVPAKEVGGDFYDFYLIDENHLAFLIADVSGKGISAAMFMMKAKTLIKSYADREKDVAQILTRANNELCEGNDADMFVTCWMGIIDFRTNIVSFANAGHNAPLIRHKDGSFEYLKVRSGFVLAAMEDIKYHKGEFELLPGDEIFLYTDGVTEAINSDKEFYGDARLEKYLNTLGDIEAEKICKNVKADIDSFVGDAPQFDDITMLCLKIMPKNIIRVKPSLDTMQDVIDFVENILESADVPKKVIYKMNIAIDEVYSNIIRYSGADDASVECSLANGKITLTFIDNGSPYNPLENKDPDTSLSAEEREIGGLGIFMVKKTMDDIKYSFEDERNILVLQKDYLA